MALEITETREFVPEQVYLLGQYVGVGVWGQGDRDCFLISESSDIVGYQYTCRWIDQIFLSQKLYILCL